MAHEPGEPGGDSRKREDDGSRGPPQDRPAEECDEGHQDDLRDEDLTQLRLREQRHDDLRLERVGERPAQQLRHGERQLGQERDEPRERRERGQAHEPVVDPREQ